MFYCYLIVYCFDFLCDIVYGYVMDVKLIVCVVCEFYCDDWWCGVVVYVWFDGVFGVGFCCFCCGDVGEEFVCSCVVRIEWVELYVYVF